MDSAQNKFSGIDSRNHGTYVTIGVASPEVIRSWSHGEVKSPETINYRTFKPEKGGLFCERTFGPTRDYECSCGKYKRQKHKGIICDRCLVEVTESRVRRERMGHLELAVPVSHVWFFKCMPSRLGLLLDMSGKDLENILYYENWVVTEVKDTQLTKDKVLNVGDVLTEEKYAEFKDLYGDKFVAKMGGEAVEDLLGQLNLREMQEELTQDLITNTSKMVRKKTAKRIRLVEGFLNNNMDPRWMILHVLPVIPPELRPLVPLEGGRFATSDLNDLYRRVINRNSRLKNLLQLHTPEVIIRNEKRMLQEAVDALLDNGRQGRAVTGTGNRPLKSLSDMLKGKQGRFRQNLLGKRVDYSGRSVIVVGPELRLNQCGLPKEMALTLFEPFIMSLLKRRGHVHTVRNAKKWIDQKRKEVWDILDEVTKGHPILLNRAPTLHRLSIQAFDPILIEGQAIRLHPLVCTAFNADFDGDQMAVHVPLSNEAQLEAKLIMLAPNNIFSPASGKPIATPSQDITLGVYYLTYEDKKRRKAFLAASAKEAAWLQRSHDMKKRLEDARQDLSRGSISASALRELKKMVAQDEADLQGEIAAEEKYIRRYNDYHELLRAFEIGEVKMHDFVYLRNPFRGKDTVWGQEVRNNPYIATTIGRCIFNEVWPEEMGFYNGQVTKKEMGKLIKECYERVGRVGLIKVLDMLKDLGYEYATKAGFSIGIKDMIIPAEKKVMIEQAQKEIDMFQKQRLDGSITDQERFNKSTQAWTDVNNNLAELLTGVLEENEGRNEINPVFAMLDSGARGSKDQIRQLAGMRGLMAKPNGAIIENPIKANFREGLSVLEYFISSHGARKGLSDTALKTADSGYMTRRLVDVAHDVICTEDDCGTVNGIYMKAIKDGAKDTVSLTDRIVGRFSADDIKDFSTGKLLVAAGEEITADIAKQIVALSNLDKVHIRSVLTCESEHGVCCKCYGRNLATGDMPYHGDPVGIIAAQSIGEPGTQLTMRTFHKGGIAATSESQKSHRARKDGKLELGGITVDDEEQLVPITIMKEVVRGSEASRGNATLFVDAKGKDVYYKEGFTRIAKDQRDRASYIQYCKMNGIPLPEKNKDGFKSNPDVALLEGYLVLGQTAHFKMNYASEQAIKEGTSGETEMLELPQGSIIYYQDGMVKKDACLAEWDPFNLPIDAKINGVVRYKDLIEGTTIENSKNYAGKIEHKVVEHSDDIRPAFEIVDMIPMHVNSGECVKLRFEIQLLQTSAEGYSDLAGETRKGGSEKQLYRFDDTKFVKIKASDVRPDEIKLSMDASGRRSLVISNDDLRLGKLLRLEIIGHEFEKVSKGDALTYDAKRKPLLKAPCDGVDMIIDDIHFGKVEDEHKIKQDLLYLIGLKLNNTIELDRFEDLDGMRIGAESTAFFRVKDGMKKSQQVGLALVRKRDEVQLQEGAYFTVDEGELVEAGDELAKFPRQNVTTRDITGGLPRVAELFEARHPKKAAEIARIDGQVSFEKAPKGRQVICITDPESGVREEQVIPAGKRIIVNKDDYVSKGTPLTNGSLVLHDLLDICGPQELQEYMLNEVQQVYRLQGVEINDKHVEVIIRQMMRKVRITDPGQTRFLYNEQVDKRKFQEENERVLNSGGIPAEAQQMLLGISKTSLSTDSFISEASFQDTTRVLSQAATFGRVDYLRGFKENVIMGHLIPAGTGYHTVQNVKLTFNVATAEEAEAETAALEISKKEAEEREKLAKLEKLLSQ